MNSDQLRQFKTIAECGNLTKAAEHLYITQPALSISLTKLESEIGKLLFIRKGRQLELTENGENLLKYAKIVTETIDEAEKFFKVPDDVQVISVYRIGGTAASLLLSGSYNLSGYQLRLQLVHNSETPEIVGQAIAVFIIADDRYMKTAVYQGVEKVFLYRQHLLLSVRKDDPLAERDEISITELSKYDLVGRSGTKGFNDWIKDVEDDNQCNIKEVTHSDYIFYATEGEHISQPFLMSSFGESLAMSQKGFSNRKNIRVTGEYTERDIYLWYDNRIKHKIQPYIDLIKRNAEMIIQADSQM